jgi:hypothetical protein
MLMVVFWVVTPCSLIGGNQYFMEMYASILKVEICSSKTVITSYKTIWCHNPENAMVTSLPS